MEGTWLFHTPSWTEKPVAFTWRSYSQNASVSGVPSAAPKQSLLLKHKSKYRKAQQKPDEQVSQFPPVQEEREEEEEMTEVSTVLKSMVMVRKAVSQT